MQPRSKGAVPNQHANGEIMKRLSETWTPPAWLEPAFIGIAFSVAIVAFATLLLWGLITFVVPFNVYSRETEAIVLDNGQTLQVRYPNVVLAGDTPSYILLILTEESNKIDPAGFTVNIPSGLTVVEPVAQSQSNTVQLTAPNLGNTVEPSQMKIGVVNSRSMGGILLFVRQPIGIRSDVMPLSQRVEIGVETISWTSARGIVNNTINERSTLILLVTGFLSGAGTLILQSMKTHRDRVREDRQRKEERFYKFMQEDFEGAINVFLRNGDRSLNLDDFVMYKTLIEQTNWYPRLSGNVREKLKKREFAEAMRLARMLKQLCGLISQPKDEEEIELQALHKLCELATITERQNKMLSQEDARSLLTVYQHWKELGSIVTDLIQDFSRAPKNLFVLYNVMQNDKDGAGRKLLENSNLQHVIRDWQMEALSKAEMEILQTIKNETAYSIRWRPLWAAGEQNLSERVRRWLSGHWYE